MASFVARAKLRPLLVPVGVTVLVAGLLSAPALPGHASADTPQSSSATPQPLVADGSSPVQQSSQGRGPQPIEDTVPVVADDPITQPDWSAPDGLDPQQSTVAARTATSVDYANPDGTHTVKVSQEPINYLTPAGSWEAIDNSVSADPDRAGGLTNGANSWRVHFGSTTQGVSFDTAAGSLALTAVGATKVTPQRSGTGDGVTYAEAWPGVDLSYTVTGATVKESLLIKNRGAASTYRFVARAGDHAATLGLTAPIAALVSQSDGSLRPSGVLGSALQLQQPVVLAHSGEPLEAAHASLVSVAGQLRLSIDPLWLAAQPDSAFPINLDPTVHMGTNATDAYKSDGYVCTGCQVQVGNSVSAGDTYWRSLAHFDLSSIFGDQVLSTSISAVNTGGTTNAYGVNVYAATAFSYGGAYGSGSVLASGAPGAGGTLSGSGLTSDISTQVNNSSNAQYLGLRGSETAGTYTYQSFTLTLYVTVNHKPTVAQPVAPSPANGSSSHHLTYTFKASSTDADGDALKYYFRVATGSDAETNVVFNSGWITTDTTNWSAPQSLWNTRLYWHVYVKDLYWETAPDYVDNFKPSNSPPTAPVQTGSLPADQAIVSTTTPALSVPAATDPDGDTVLYDFTISGGGDAPAGRASSGWQTSRTWSVPAGVLQDGQSYQWNVATADGTAASPWTVTTPTWSNTVVVNQRLGDPGPTPSDSLAGVTTNLANGNALVSVAPYTVNTVAGALGVGFTYNSQASVRNGLLGQYFAEKDRNWTVDSGESPALVRIDPSLDLRWNQAGYPLSPPGLPVAQFLVHWTGFVTLPATLPAGNYQLGVESDDGARIYWSATRTLIYNDWSAGAAGSSPAWSSTVALTPGVTVPIEVDYFNQGGPGQFSFFAKGVDTSTAAAVPQQIVPSNWLTSAVSALPTGWSMTLPTATGGYTHAAVGDGMVVLTDGVGAAHTYLAQSGGGFTPPVGEDSVLAQDSAGLLTLHDSDGTIYTFDAQGNPLTATTPADSLHPASASYSYDASVTPARITAINDVVSGRSINLYYGSDGHCASVAGYDSPPAPNLLCQVGYWDGSTTNLYYVGGLLSAVYQPGSQITQFGYTNGLLSNLISPLANSWRLADWPNRSAAPVDTQISYTWVAPAPAGSTNVRPPYVPVSAPYPAGSVPLVTSVLAPSADGSSPRTAAAQHTYSYLSSNETQLHIAGLATAVDRDVSYDSTGRTLTTASATGQTSTTAWNSQDKPVSLTDPAGRKTTTVYDWAGRATDSYGPAPASCFQSSGLPVASPPSSCGQIPHDHLGYDTDTHGTRLTGLETSHWSNPDLAGNPDQRVTAAPRSAGWSSSQVSALSPAGGSSRFTGELALNPASYSFSATVGDLANDGVRVLVDDQPVIDRWWTLRQAELASGPIGYWRLGDPVGSGSAANQVSGGAAGVPTGVTFGSAAEGPVDPSTSGSFNGSTSVVTVPDSTALNPSGALTLEAWIKPTAVSTQRMIITKDQANGATSDPFEFRLMSNGQLQFLQADGSTYYTATSSSVVSSGAWHHVVVTKTPTGAVTFYIDGLADPATATFPASIPGNTQPVLIGRRADGSSFNGLIADAAIYGYALSTIDVGTHYAAGTAKLTSMTPITFSAASAVVAGSLPVAPVSTPHRVRVEYRNPSAAANLSVSATPSGGSATVISDNAFDPRYGLATYSVKDDSGGVAGGAETTATGFSGGGLDPVYALATDQVVDPNGLNLDVKTSYEAPGHGYLRATARALPSADLANSSQSRTTQYYGDTETRDIPCTGGATNVNQGGLPRLVTDPTPAAGSAVATETVYDQAGRIAATRNPNDGASWTCTTYTAEGRVASVSVPSRGGSPARTVSYNYAAGGNPLANSVTDQSGTVTTVVDLLGRPVSYADASGVVTTTSYDQAGRATGSLTTAPGGGASSSVGSSYFDDGRLNSVTLDGNVVATASYDGNAELTGVSYPSGSGNAGNGGSLGSIVRNPAGHQLGQTWTLPGSHAIVESQTMSQGGRITADSTVLDGTTSSNWGYGYDAAGRLVHAQLDAAGSRPAVSYDYGYPATGGCGADSAAGLDSVRSTQTVTVGAASPLTTVSCADYASRLTSATGANAVAAAAISYDGHGNLTQLGNQTFSYDSSDRLVAASVVGGGTSQSFAYTIDLSGRMISRTVTGSGTGSANGTEKYGYVDSSDDVGVQLNGSNQLLERYLSLPGGVLLTERYNGAGSPIWSLPNLHGDVIATTDGAGALTESGSSYDPFGQPIDPSTGQTNTAATPVTRSGGPTDAWEGGHQRAAEFAGGADLILMGARLYLPMWGQFTSPDPITGGNSNPYTYPADPVNMDDLTGLKHHWWKIAAAVAVVAVAVVVVTVATGGIGDAAALAAFTAESSELAAGASAAADASAVADEAATVADEEAAAAARAREAAQRFREAEEKTRKAVDREITSGQQVAQTPPSAWMPAATHFADPFLVTAFAAAAAVAKAGPVIIRLGRMAIDALRLL